MISSISHLEVPMTENVNETSSLDGVEACPPAPKMSLETLILLIHTERLKSIRDQTASEFKELHERQGKVRKLHEAMKGINKETNEKGELHLKEKPELQELLTQAKELGLEVNPEKLKYSKEERERLLDNLKMTIEDLNIQNDMQMQTVQRLTNERYESFQMARSILKPLHDDKQNKARQMAGR